MFNTATLEPFLEPLKKYLKDPNAVEIQVNEPGTVWVETVQEGMQAKKDARISVEYFEQLARNLSNQLLVKNFDSKPYLATTLPGGHRIQVCLGTTLKTRVAVSIRVFRPRTFTIDHYGLDPFQRGLIDHAIHHKWNVLLSGGMFSGKTSFLNAMLALIPTNQRCISVEDSPELDLQHLPNRVEFIVNRLATEHDIDYAQVLMAITRLRPDRTFVGELNIDNTWTMARILNLGHGGTVASIHADTPELAFEAAMVNIEAFGVPISAAGKILRNRIDLILQIARLPDYSRKIVDMWVNPTREKEVEALKA